MKKLAVILLLLTFTLTLSGCDNNEENKEPEEIPITDAMKFKNEYENLNGEKNSNGDEHRTITIAEDNPIIYASADDIVKKMEDGETFYVYFGFSTCPWCRSVLEKALEVAKEKNIETIYYVDVFDIRDTFELDENNKAVQTKKGTEGYQKLIELMANVLDDYNLTTENGKKVSTKEKRIYAPNYVYVKDGKAKTLVEGTSKKQTEARMTLTEEMLKDEEEIFTKFFTN